MHTWPAPVTDIVNWDHTLTGKTPTWPKLAMRTILVVGAQLYLVVAYNKIQKEGEGVLSSPNQILILPKSYPIIP